MLTTNLVGYWKFDESSGDAADSVGTNTLANVGTAAYGAGKINNGVTTVAATPSYLHKVTPNTIPGAGNTGGDMTVNIWVKPTSQPGTNNADCIVSVFQYSTPKYSWRIRYLQDGSDVKSLQFFASSNGTSLNWITIGQVLNNATWYMITATYTAASHTVEFFINGTSIGTGDVVATSLFNTDGDFEVGVTGASNETSNMQFDELGIWTRILAGSEITSLYNSGTGLQYPFGEGGTVRPKPNLLLMGVG